MSKIVAADLVDRVNGKYSLLALGEVVNNSLGLIEIGLDIYWKLKTNDALKADKGTNIPRAEHRHLVDTLAGRPANVFFIQWVLSIIYNEFD